MRHIFIDPNRNLCVALEEQTTGVKQDEIEDVYYARIVNFEELKKASEIIEQKQAAIRGKEKGSQIRVRQATSGGSTKYILTGKKIKEPGSGALDEVSTEVSKDMLDIFLVAAGEYQHKTRYVFPIADSDLAWEVDVFFDATGKMCEWCKLDLENPPEETPRFPIELSDVIYSKELAYTAEQQSVINDLYRNKWCIKT